MAFEKGYALVIGVGSYANIPWANIPVSMADAQAVARVLSDPNLCGYLPDHITFLADDKASKASILEALERLSLVPADHTALLYYCGHGADGTDGNYYLTTHETQVASGKVVKGTGISEGELLDALRKVPAKRLLLLLNACHSGEISPSLGLEEEERAFGDATLPLRSADALLSTGEGRVIITACRPEQKSWVGTGKLTIFTQALVDGLSGKGYVPNNNGFIGAFGLYEHVYEAVKDAAAALGKPQEPELTVLRGVGPFAVALYRGAADLGAFDANEAIMEGAAARRVDPARSARAFQQVIKTITASGERSVAAETMRDNIIVTGDHNVVQGSKYNVKVNESRGIVIGDNAHVEQHFDE